MSNGNWVAECLVINVGPLANIPVVVVAIPTLVPIAPTAVPAAPPQNCDPSYPDFCLEPGIADLDCGDIPQYAVFTVLQPDPHGFDGSDNDGLGCEGN